jgi:hypothetical protein
VPPDNDRFFKEFRYRFPDNIFQYLHLKII